jgi:taurine dioxygenase
MQLNTRHLSDAFGLEVLDVDLADVDAPTFDAIYQLWQHEPLLVFRRQSLTEPEHLAFSRRFGDLDLIVRDDMHSPLNPEVIYITSLMRPDGTPLGGLGSYEVRWHHDQVYRQRPASGSIFYAVEMPEDGGRTSFCNTQLAYETLPETLRAQVDGKAATCKYGNKPSASFQRDFTDDPKRIQTLDNRTPPATHDIVLENPATGKRSLYIDPDKTQTIGDMNADDSQALIEKLRDHILQDKFIYTHSSRNGDVIMWDNARLWHRREAFDETLPRLAKRTTIFLRPEDFAVPEPDMGKAAE